MIRCCRLALLLLSLPTGAPTEPDSLVREGITAIGRKTYASID